MVLPPSLCHPVWVCALSPLVRLSPQYCSILSYHLRTPQQVQSMYCIIPGTWYVYSRSTHGFQQFARKTKTLPRTTVSSTGCRCCCCSDMSNAVAIRVRPCREAMARRARLLSAFSTNAHIHTGVGSNLSTILEMDTHSQLDTGTVQTMHLNRVVPNTSDGATYHRAPRRCIRTTMGTSTGKIPGTW